jgi:hypothetical protein
MFASNYDSVCDKNFKKIMSQIDHEEVKTGIFQLFINHHCYTYL